MPRSAGFVEIQALERSAERLRPLKRRTYELMGVAPGARVLDVGCGPGLDTVELAALVGRMGEVVGVDLDEEMLAAAAARARAAGVAGWVRHRPGTATDLPYEAGTFDACRAERLFQVLPRSVDPQRVMAELARVTKPAGRIVAADADWGAASIDAPDTETEAALRRYFAERRRPNGYAGRQLYRFFRRQGLLDLEVETRTTHYSTAEVGPFEPAGVRAAVADGALPQDAAQRWLAWLEEAGAEGVLSVSIPMVIVAGRTH